MGGSQSHSQGFMGPKSWALWSIIGLAIGTLASFLLHPATNSQGTLLVPLYLVTPFALLLASIAFFPMTAPKFWHSRYPEIALFAGCFVAAIYLIAFGKLGGPAQILHSVIEYYSFIALVGGLFVVSGNIVVEVRGNPSPLLNTSLLAIGAVLANLVGTTGASMLLIRPFMRVNQGRIRPLHIVFFIFIVSNCGGCLTPVGDPPLYLGFLKGVPFQWTLQHLWMDWLLVNGLLLLVFYFVDKRIGPASTSQKGNSDPGLAISGKHGLIALALMLACVFVDPLLGQHINLHHFPVGATLQLLIATWSYSASSPENRKINRFSFEPAKEVSLLFAGIFLTMIPALGYLSANGSSLGLSHPTASVEATRFYFSTGSLSAVLDNAPTYLNFLQIAVAANGNAALTREVVAAFATNPQSLHLLHAISASAVFFGAMTYIGNGPNFMVKAIAEAESIKMPNFGAYVGYACCILLPILILDWYLFVH